MNRFYAILRATGTQPRKIAAQVSKNIRMDYAVEMYQRGDPLASIAAETGITPGSLSLEFAKRGLKPNRRDPGFDYDKACKMYVDGVALVDIYVQTGISNTPKLYKQLRKRGIPLRKPRQQNDSEFAQFYRTLPSDMQQLVRDAVGFAGSSQTDSTESSRE